MVASACDRVRGSGDPTAHAVIGTLREAAKRLGTTSLSGLTVYVVREPCAMCVGAMLESDVDGVVFAVPDAQAGAAGSALQLARGVNGHAHRLNVVSGILEADAAELLARSDRQLRPRQPRIPSLTPLLRRPRHQNLTRPLLRRRRPLPMRSRLPDRRASRAERFLDNSQPLCRE